ncbi:MAG: heavy metal translocating P-type ATPase [Firmicutes bacterium]|nr:heavy metal translocating P-type ATPase [Bacillota bacterium]
MQQYNVTGMSCAACSARVEKAVGKVPGITSCSVSLLTNSMGVEGSASPAEIIKAVTDAGYGASLKGAKGAAASPSSDEDMLKDTETPKLRKRLIRSVVVLLVLMYFSMGHMMWGWPAPAAFDNLVFLGTFEMLLAIVCLIINGKFFTSGFSSLFHGAPNMDTLVALGSTASFGYSLVELFGMILAMGNGDHMRVMELGMNLYFESAAMIPTLITVGKMLEAMSKGRTTDALKGLMKLAPKTAVVIDESGSEKEVPIEAVKTGDIFVVRPGASVPVDGIVTEGHTAVNESALTGESIPVDKEEGDLDSAATVNQSGYIRCRATRVGEDTTLAQIIKTVSDAAATKAPLARIADKVSGIFVPAVMGIAALTLIGWLMAGRPFSFAIARAISVLVISCPCALGLATPVAIMVGSGVGARKSFVKIWQHTRL